MTLSINALATPLLDALLRDSDALRIAAHRADDGCLVVDAGVHHPGGIETGRRLVELCLAGLGNVVIAADSRGADTRWPYALVVTSGQPVLACLASQYAGWQLSEPDGGKFRAMASGPARALAAKEKLFNDLAYRDYASRSFLLLEADRFPPSTVTRKVATDCALAPADMTFIIAPTTSMAGLTQVVGRVLEVGLHKAHELGFPLDAIREGIASAPLAPPSPDFMVSMSRGNDAILFAGHVHLTVDIDDDAARDLALQLPSSSSADYGQPFGDVFKAAGYDFYKIDPMLFAPAEVLVTNLRSGRTFAGGRRDAALLAKAFGGPE